MKIIIAPAKKMKTNSEAFPVKTLPLFFDKAKVLYEFLQSQNLEQLKNLWQVNDKIAQKNYDLLQINKIDQNLTPALFAFSGIQYQYLAADILEQDSLDYLQKNLRVVSGLYGLLRPFDGIIPYRLEMQTTIIGFSEESLYNYWSDLPYKSIFENNEIVINLASKEYSKLFSPYIENKQYFVNIDFLENKNGKWRQIATHSKMARGAMVQFMARNKVKNVNELKQFSDFDYQFDEEISTPKQLIFKKSIL